MNSATFIAGLAVVLMLFFLSDIFIKRKRRVLHASDVRMRRPARSTRPGTGAVTILKPMSTGSSRTSSGRRKADPNECMNEKSSAVVGRGFLGLSEG